MKSHTKAITFFSVIVAILSMQLPCSAQQPDAKSILLGAAAALERHTSVEYTATFSEMNTDWSPEMDTVTQPGEIKLIRDSSDTLWGGKIFLKVIYIHSGTDTIANDTDIKIYDLHSVYEIDSKNHKITEYDPHNDEKWSIEGNNSRALIWKYFLHPDMLREAAKAGNAALNGVEIINNVQCYKITIPEPDEDDFTNRNTLLYISLKDSLPLFQEEESKFQANIYRNNMRIGHYLFDRASDISLPKNIQNEYALEKYSAQPQANYTLLDIGTAAPQLAGKIYQNNLDSTVINYRGKITLLDFWYRNCEWCIKAFPTIEKIFNEYKNARLQVIGVNSYDNDAKAIKTFPTFFKYNPTHYNTVLTQISVTNSFHAYWWPTFYIINGDGKIVYRTAGYSDDLYDRLDKRITELLK